MDSEATSSGDFTIGQLRAKSALDAVNGLKDSKNIGNYVSYVKALPATVLQAGLGQAMATELAAAKGNRSDPHFVLFEQVESWLCDSGHGVYKGQKDLLVAITTGDEHQYLVAQGEALAYLNWLKKFAVAYLSQRDTANSPGAA